MAAFPHVPVMKYDDRPTTKAYFATQELESESTAEAVQILEVTSEGSCDIEGLLAYLDNLQQNGIRFVEATYIANTWTWNSLVPFEHHGFLLSMSSGEYLSLDFGRRGIMWDIFDDYPDHPDGTFLVTRYLLDRPDDIRLLQQYCRETKPFFFMYNDCKSWCDGLRRLLKMELVHTSPSNAKPEEQRRRPQRDILGFVSCM